MRGKMDYAILGFLSLLTLFLLLSGVLAFNDDQRTRGSISILASFALLALTLLYVYPRLGLDDGDTVRLKAEVAKLESAAKIATREKQDLKTQADALAKSNESLSKSKSELEANGAELRFQADAAKRDAQSLKTQLETLAKSNEQMAKQKAALELSAAETLSTIEQNLSAVRDHARDPSSNLQLPLPDPAGDPASSAERIKRQLEALKTISGRPIPNAAETTPRQQQLTDLVQLRDKLAAQLTTPNYDVNVYPNKELVQGQRGRYYAVDLKNAKSGIRYYFESGKYTIDRSIPEFRESLNAFIKDVLTKLDGNVNYQLLVRGRADAAPWQGKFDPAHVYQQIKYMRSAGDDRYLSDMGEDHLTGALRNENLPNLRAAFLAELIADNFSVKPPMILEGGVSPKTGDKDRNAEMFLYVDW